MMSNAVYLPIFEENVSFIFILGFAQIFLEVKHKLFITFCKYENTLS